MWDKPNQNIDQANKLKRKGVDHQPKESVEQNDHEGKVEQSGRITVFHAQPDLKRVVEDPGNFESSAGLSVAGRSCFIEEVGREQASAEKTLLLVSAERGVIDELKQIVVKSRKDLRLCVLDYVPHGGAASSKARQLGNIGVGITR
jgi:hypothetical protein